MRICSPLMDGFRSKYSDLNLFFDGAKNLYDARDYMRGRQKAGPRKEDRPWGKRQFLSSEDKEVAFLIRNRDLENPRIKKVDSKDYHVGRFVG